MEIEAQRWTEVEPKRTELSRDEQVLFRSILHTGKTFYWVVGVLIAIIAFSF